MAVVLPVLRHLRHSPQVTLGGGSGVPSLELLDGTTENDRPTGDLKQGLQEGQRQASTAVVSVTTRGLVIWPAKSRLMKDSMSSNSPARSSSSIICVPEYESISLR